MRKIIRDDDDDIDIRFHFPISRVPPLSARSSSQQQCAASLVLTTIANWISYRSIDASYSYCTLLTRDADARPCNRLEGDWRQELRSTSTLADDRIFNQLTNGVPVVVLLKIINAIKSLDNYNNNRRKAELYCVHQPGKTGRTRNDRPTWELQYKVTKHSQTAKNIIIIMLTSCCCCCCCCCCCRSIHQPSSTLSLPPPPPFRTSSSSCVSAYVEYRHSTDWRCYK